MFIMISRLFPSLDQAAAAAAAAVAATATAAAAKTLRRLVSRDGKEGSFKANGNQLRN